MLCQLGLWRWPYPLDVTSHWPVSHALARISVAYSAGRQQKLLSGPGVIICRIRYTWLLWIQNLPCCLPLSPYLLSFSAWTPLIDCCPLVQSNLPLVISCVISLENLMPDASWVFQCFLHKGYIYILSLLLKLLWLESFFLHHILLLNVCIKAISFFYILLPY